MQSVMKHQFSQIPRIDVPRSSFNRSAGLTTCFDAGYLVPCYWDEVLPSDTFKARFSHFTRLTTPIVPLMDNVYLETFFFFVPKRLVWEHWQNFCGEKEDIDDETQYVIPQVESGDTGFARSSLYDYFGIPPEKKTSVSALPLRCYNLIYNEWFRDENLCPKLPVYKDDGPDPVDAYNLAKRGKRHDYFTSCLPWPQKGPGVEINLAGTASVYGNGMGLGLTDGTNFAALGTNDSSSGIALIPRRGTLGTAVGSSSTGSSYLLDDKVVGVTTDPENSGLVADLSDTSVVTINSLRQAFQIQKMLEKDARGGTRYSEIIRSHFGCVSPDARLQRPEYLGGTSTRIHFHPVAQTSASDSTTPQGNLGAFAVGSNGDELVIDKSFVEHGYIIGLVNIRADLRYQQGLDRMWSRKTRYDFYWPSLAHLGEQAVLNKEIYLQGNDQDEEVFGYQERFAEYRYKNSMITGKMRSSDPQSLDVWHLAQNFGNLPVLNQEFIEDNPPISRVLAVQDEPQFFSDMYIECFSYRPMPTYSVPGLIDHF